MYKIIRTFSDILNVFNGLVVPVGNMGIPRSAMPQIDSQHQSKFIAFLKSNNVQTKSAKMPAHTLKLTQSEINKFKVLKLMEIYRSKSEKLSPIIVSSDNFVLDGSHRVVAVLNINRNEPVNVLVCNLPMVDLIKLSQKFQYASFRSVSDSKLAK